MKMKSTIYLRLLLLLALCGLSACATYTVKKIPVEVKPLTGDLVDAQRLMHSYITALGAETNNELLAGSEYEPVWYIYPSVFFDRGGMGTMATVSVALRNVKSGEWYASKNFVGLSLVGSENRDAQVEALLKKSIGFVRDTVRQPVASVR